MIDMRKKYLHIFLKLDTYSHSPQWFKQQSCLVSYFSLGQAWVIELDVLLNYHRLSVFIHSFCINRNGIIW